MFIKCVILWICYLGIESRASLAPFIKPCTPLDSKCILNSAKLALPYFAKGVSELGIPAVEPLAIKKIVADSGELKLTFRKVKVHHLSKCEFVSISRDPVRSTGSLMSICPIIIDGDYTLGGKLLSLDIEGNGGFEIKGGKMRVSVDFKLKEFKGKDGKKHYKLSSFDYKYEPIEKFDIIFENLFNGDRVKAEPIEKILSESWKELILDVGKPVIKEGMTLLAGIIDKMFHAVPAEDLEIV